MESGLDCEKMNDMAKKVVVDDMVYNVIRKRKLKNDEKVVGFCRTISGKKFNLIHRGKIKLMMSAQSDALTI